MKFNCSYTELVELHKLQENPRNSNNHPDRQIELLAKIIDYQGQRAPIVVSKRSGFITKGHGRLMALQKLGWEKAAVDYQDYDSEAQEYADLIADNKIAELAKHDDAKMIEDLKDLDLDDYELLGLDDFSLPDEVDPAKEEIEDDVPDNVETRCKPGDLWILGEHRLLCGDSTNIQHVERLMGGEKADMVFTDPPYGVNYDSSWRDKIGGTPGTESSIQGDLEFPDFVSLIKSPIFYCWHASTKSEKLLSLSRENNYELKSQIIWTKPWSISRTKYNQLHEPCFYFVKKGSDQKWIGDNKQTTVWALEDHRHPSKRDTGHPTEKPVKLAEIALKNHDAKNIHDPFGGSGSTLIACEKTKRKCFMMELDPHYCDTIIQRWENYSGKEAKLVTDGQTS